MTDAMPLVEHRVRGARYVLTHECVDDDRDGQRTYLVGVEAHTDATMRSLVLIFDPRAQTFRNWPKDWPANVRESFEAAMLARELAT